MRVMGIWAGFLFLCPRPHQLLSPSEASASFSQRGGSKWDEGEKGEGKTSREGVWSDIENSRVIRRMSSQRTGVHELEGVQARGHEKDQETDVGSEMCNRYW